jgi:hypothetical protein
MSKQIITTEEDEYGNVTMRAETTTFTTWMEYKDGNPDQLIHYKNSLGDEYWKGYDDRGNEVLYRDATGEETIWEFDDANNITHYKDITTEYWKTYDFKHRLREYKFIKTGTRIGDEETTLKRFDKKSNCIYSKDINGHEVWYKHDENGEMTHYKTSTTILTNNEWHERLWIT